ncbi:acetyl-CoA synthetase-like protein [Dissoconium aciculare CBS 342.82]|uniref:Acetyl-CoA synthetase-like protein n=1 Tax=Dissoconium aciculare CBS 342.82 TaxID=1314786 RepID=A0A6J3MI80_9PEZI|nr:acetyl-CoA synthetase-like protein [Dissoconium aciculare CBS 342.82]KAF1827636.1 acetyl-CoA synthetase-like protein [Dissoconium aciculare CBS 342.82]
MSDLTAFPGLQGDSQSHLAGQWRSISFSSILSRTDRSNIEDPQAAILLAYAGLIWSHTGEQDVCFLVRFLDETTLSYTHSLCISDELSIKQAVEYTNNTKQSFSDDSTSPSNVLIQVPHMSSLQSCRPIDEIPLQIYGQVDGVGREARFPDDILRQTVVHIESDMAWIKALNSAPQKLDARTIHDSIKEVCDRNPNSVAIEAWDGRFTRLQLHELSEKLAFTLARAHVKRGCTVAVVMDKSIWYSSYSFIISVVDSISTLLVGGTICIPGNDERMNDLDGAIRRLQPAYACLTPSLAKSLDPTKVSSIKTLVLVGEAIPRSLAESWLASGKVVVRNGYGQSEACSMNSTVVLRPNDKAAYRSIGRSTWLRYWIVDPRDHHRLMPVGALGELIVEGYSIALDYYDDEQKTSAAFIESPRWAAEFGAGTEGRRWYKTGDLVQYQQNGELHLFGRKDTQTKINGQRLEASEVEHHILQAFAKEISQNSAALFPLTDFQQHYLRGAEGVSGGYVCEYDLSFGGSFELARLEKAVRLLIEKTEALRLTFVHESAETEAPLKQKAFPPTKEELLLRCQVQRKGDPAPPLMLTWEAHDKLRHPVVFVLKHSDVHEERSPTEASSIDSHISMLIRMHHAIFDGIFWSLILDDLIFAYEHGHLGKERPSYLQYLETRLIRRDPESLEYWSRLLKDSTPTRLRRDSDAFNSITADRVVPEHEAARLINFAREKGKPTGFQQATGPDKAVSGAVLSMSAWALTLRCILTAMRPADNHDDILFLALMHGRDEDGRYRADEIIGCCVTEIPIRVRLSEELTPAGLFTAVQKQLLESASHAHLGANTIAKHCTTWKSKEHFYRQSTFFMFQNVKEGHHLAVDGRREQGPAADKGGNGDDASSAGGYMDISPTRVVQDLRCDFEGHASMADHGTLEFGLASRAEDYSQDETDAVADAYVKAVRLLTEEHDMTIGDMRRRILREVAGVPV